MFKAMLSLEEKVGQMLMVGFHGLKPPDYILEWLSSGRIGGVVLFSRNVAHPQQLADLTQACHEAAKYPILIAIDQEGGTVARLREGFAESPGAMALGAADSEALAEEVAYVLGTELKALGINWNLAPVVDITHNINNPSVGARSLGSNKTRVSQLAVAQIRGFQKAGVAATAKHFPGIGNTPIDTHEAMAVIDSPLDTLWQQDLVPFRTAIAGEVATVMISHVMVKAIDSQHPSTLSSAVIQGLLRQETQFNGLICTDCMEMKAITDHYNPGESAVLAALAGEDIIFFSHSFSPTHKSHAAAYDTLLHAVRSGRVPIERIDAAVERIGRLKKHFQIVDRPHIELVNRKQHLVVMEKAARAGVVLVKESPELLPLQDYETRRVVAVEFASILESGVMDQGGITGFCRFLHNRAPYVHAVAFFSSAASTETREQIRQLISACDVLILATRNAHLIPHQLAYAREFIALAPKTILICLRNPYDATVLPEAHAVLCTCGDSTPSLSAAVDALTGQFIPTGKLPVPIELQM